MHKSDYFLGSIVEERYRDRKWILRTMCLPASNLETEADYPGYRDGVWYILDHNGEEEVLEGTTPDAPIFPIKEPLELTPQNFLNVREPVTSCYGAAILNAVVLLYAFGKKLPYMAERFNDKKLAKIVGNALETDLIGVPEYLKFMEGMNHLTLFNQIAIVAATPKSLTASPEAIRIRNELLEQYKDQLGDPAIVALIDEAVSAADREYIKGDPSEKFFLKGKAYDVVRKKLFTVQGGVPRLDDPTKMDYIPGSLDEGIRPEDLATVNNNSRSGSYDRGASTALGGEAAKFSNRVFQNLKIAEVDCGTVVGKPELIEDTSLIGRYLVGSDNPLTEADLLKLIGKEVIMRDPTACKTGNRAYCGKCMGQKEVDAQMGLGPRMAEVGNTFMSISLAAFHGSVSKTTEFNPFLEIK